MADDFEALIRAESAPLLPAQMAVKHASDEMLKDACVKDQLSFVSFSPVVAPSDILGRLRASGIGDLMLRDGDSLSDPDGGDYRQDLGLYAEVANMVNVTLRIFQWELPKHRINWELPKHRINPEGPRRPPYDILTYPNEKDWIRRIDIRFLYADSGHAAMPDIGVTASSTQSGMPYFARRVIVPLYSETGYEGHSHLWRPAKDDAEVDEFLTLAKELFALRRTDVAVGELQR